MARVVPGMRVAVFFKESGFGFGRCTNRALNPRITEHDRGEDSLSSVGNSGPIDEGVKPATAREDSGRELACLWPGQRFVARQPILDRAQK